MVYIYTTLKKNVIWGMVIIVSPTLKSMDDVVHVQT